LINSVIFGAYERAYCIRIEKVARRKCSTGCRFMPRSVRFEDRMNWTMCTRIYGCAMDATN
jgi:hypothetical protein